MLNAFNNFTLMMLRCQYWGEENVGFVFLCFLTTKDTKNGFVFRRNYYDLRWFYSRGLMTS